MEGRVTVRRASRIPGLQRDDLVRGEAFIDGAWVGAESRISVENPADGLVVGDVPDLGAGEATQAVTAAQDAMPGWQTLTGKARGQVLRRWSELMLAHAEDLARIMTAEQGKPLAEARGEVAYAAAFLEWFAEEARRVNGDILTPHASDKRLTVLRRPVGVVAAITPWNFPLAMITRKAGPALAVGCTMVVKPSELTPLSALALARLGQEAGVPPGVFNVITGQAAPIGDVLTGDPRIRKFTFTGSTAVGKMLAARCMATVKRVSLELGGNAPFIVFDDADIEAAVDGAIASKFRNTGQTCVCANRFFVQAGIHDRFAAALAARVGGLRLGPGLIGAFDQGPLIDARAVAKVRAHIADAVGAGARILTGGQSATVGPLFFQPTVLVDVRPDALVNREETFGPLAAITRFETEAEAIRMANDTSTGLAAYVFTQDMSRGVRLSETLECGMVGLNAGLISTEVAPFGGVKESGMGREGSRYGLEDYLDLKLVCANVA
ncbi:MAG: NAD-dependent succinate-semialdehyde dehydrogenase [Caulobacter sp.]|nr:NAD-dependent succinate-semialdehyde dehydrogenase [Caulobacter sp.]